MKKVKQSFKAIKRQENKVKSITTAEKARQQIMAFLGWRYFTSEPHGLVF